jgi:hypothetical protein
MASGIWLLVLGSLLCGDGYWWLGAPPLAVALVLFYVAYRRQRNAQS